MDDVLNVDREPAAVRMLVDSDFVCYTYEFMLTISDDYTAAVDDTGANDYFRAELWEKFGDLISQVNEHGLTVDVQDYITGRKAECDTKEWNGRTWYLVD